jgi:hypothetical protein
MAEGDAGTSGTARWRAARHVARAVIVLAVIAFFTVLVFKNVAPFGATVEYQIDLQEGGNKALPSPITPSAELGVSGNGVEYQVPETKMTVDMLTFDLEVPYTDLDTAEVQVQYRGDPSELLFGVRGGPESQYAYMPVHNKSLNQLNWDRIEGDQVTLFERSRDYETVDDFIAAPPMPSPTEPDYARIASYHYEVPQPRPDIDSSKVDAGTAIDATLRGPHKFYIYVGNKPLQISLIKQELNWDEGPDPLDIQVFSSEELIWATNVPDDGDERESRAISAPRKVEFTLPGLSEGVYRVDLLCNEDVVIEGLSTSQRYLSFIDGVFIADHELYELGPSKPVAVYTNAQELNAWTWHPEAFQTLNANGNQSLTVDKEGQKFLWNLSPGLNEIRTEMGDIILLSKGSSFSFSRDSFFDPFPVKLVAYNESLLFTDIRYIIAAYSVPEAEGEWLTQKIAFDLRDVEIVDNKLRCALLAPNLAQKDGEIVLGSIDIILQKDGGK